MDSIIQLNYYNYLPYNDYINLLLTNRKYYYSNDYNHDYIYRYYVIKKFTNKFAEDALSIIYSYYDFLLRIVIFENCLLKVGYPLWEEDLYYAYWKAKNLLQLKGQYILDVTMI
jgi:hypothetical protein|tara:strand:- start:370 stop:711 length:342 start_codon:yes stop_codon:yes gene_type:complete